MSTLETQYQNFLKENGDPKISYADWLGHLTKMLTETLYEARTEKLQQVKANKWEQAALWRDRELEIQEGLEDIKKEQKEVATKKPYIYESPDKGESIYRREFNNYTQERKEKL